ncbi:MAG: CRTAC1 family protein [Planctomycetaceae bacterium]
MKCQFVTRKVNSIWETLIANTASRDQPGRIGFPVIAGDRGVRLRAVVIAAVIAFPQLSAISAQVSLTDEFKLKDVAQSASLSFQHNSPFTPERHLHLTMGSGVAWIDLDQDSWPDVCFGQGTPWNGDPEESSKLELRDQVFRNRNGSFTDVTAECGILNTQYSMGFAVGDFDNDGFSDLSISCFGRPRLYRNNGDGTFEDSSRQLSGDPWTVSASCTWTDADLDGLLDLYITNYLGIDSQSYAVCSQTYRGNSIEIPCPPRRYEWPVDTLYRNVGDGCFVDVSKEARLTHSSPSAGLGVITNDFNDDHAPDLYVANDTTANFLLINVGPGQFTDQATAGGVAYNRTGEAEAGMGVTSGDVDGDGRLDIFVANYYGESNTLYRNEGHGLFLDVTSEFGLAAPSRTRLAFGTLLCDFNNDSWLDLFIANGHLTDRLAEAGMQIPFRQKCQLLLNDSGRFFKEVSATSGTYFSREVLGRGCAVADFDLDGDPDVAVQHLNDPAALLQNDGGHQNHSVTIKLIGKNRNRDAIGSTVEIQTAGRSIMRQRDGSSSYLSCNDGWLVIGVGQTEQAMSVRLKWADGITKTNSDIQHGRRICIVEGNKEAGENRVLEIPK